MIYKNRMNYCFLGTKIVLVCRYALADSPKPSKQNCVICTADLLHFQHLLNGKKCGIM